VKIKKIRKERDVSLNSVFHIVYVITCIDYTNGLISEKGEQSLFDERVKSVKSLNTLDITSLSKAFILDIHHGRASNQLKGIHLPFNSIAVIININTNIF